MGISIVSLTCGIMCFIFLSPFWGLFIGASAGAVGTWFSVKAGDENAASTGDAAADCPNGSPRRSSSVGLKTYPQLRKHVSAQSVAPAAAELH
jgi:hypothetical protein